ncbi:MAG: hypothetical protein AB1791_19600, partial [Chloroflexota bacterium]
VNDRGEVVVSSKARPGAAWLEPAAWPPAAVLLQRDSLIMPATTPPGRYRLRWRLLAGEAAVGGRPFWRPWTSDTVTAGTVWVEAWPLVTELPNGVTVAQAQFGPAIELYGYTGSEGALTPGGTLDLTLYWRALAAPDDSYYVFVHLVSPEGVIVSQADRIPVDWWRPTDGWRPGEVLTDEYHLLLPADLAPGSYDLFVGFFHPDDYRRLPVTYQGRPQPSDRLLLWPVRVVGAAGLAQ